MSDHLSPEERLLRLIRRKDKHPKAAVLNPPVSSPRRADGKNSFPVFKALEGILIALALVLIVFIVYEFFFAVKDSRDLESAAKTENLNSALFDKNSDIGDEMPPEQALKSAAYYTQPAQERDLFESPLFKKASDTQKADFTDLAKNFRLVGIVLDDAAEAVIEDTQNQQTFFLHKGDKIRDAVVEDIQESKVILLIGEQKVELLQ